MVINLVSNCVSACQSPDFRPCVWESFVAHPTHSLFPLLLYLSRLSLRRQQSIPISLSGLEVAHRHEASIGFPPRLGFLGRNRQLSDLLLSQWRYEQRKWHSLFIIARQSLLSARMAVSEQRTVLSRQSEIFWTIYLYRSIVEILGLSPNLYAQ